MVAAAAAAEAAAAAAAAVVQQQQQQQGMEQQQLPRRCARPPHCRVQWQCCGGRADRTVAGRDVPGHRNIPQPCITWHHAWGCEAQRCVLHLNMVPARTGLLGALPPRFLPPLHPQPPPPPPPLLLLPLLPPPPLLLPPLLLLHQCRHHQCRCRQCRRRHGACRRRSAPSDLGGCPSPWSAAVAPPA